MTAPVVAPATVPLTERVHGAGALPATPLVKICGLRSVAAALAAAEAGADLLGFNFAPVSKRRVAPAVAAEAITRLRVMARHELLPCHPERSPRHPERSEGSASQTTLRADQQPQRWLAARIPRSARDDRVASSLAVVGIFVNQPIDEVAAIAAACSLDFLQLSGSEDPAYCAALAARTNLPIIKAIRLARAEESEHLDRYVAGGAVSMLLADASVPGFWGGAGETWDWSAAAGLAAGDPSGGRVLPLLLAGGLTPGNVAGAIAAVHPHGVDVASGVETNGHTDPLKVRVFVQAVKQQSSTENPQRSPLRVGEAGARPGDGQRVR